MVIDARIDELLTNLKPITLDEMKDIRLMNRTDTKFVTNKENLARLLELAQGKYYAQFNEGSKIANYMTTYWDTENHKFYLEHHNGRAPRQKVRVRTYMDSDVTFLEIKTKNNHGRTKKKRVEVPSQQITGEGGNEEFLQERVHLGLSDIHPTVRNQFHRITLVNYENIKPSGFSKYCIGSVMTNDGLKQNNFRERMVTFTKLSGKHIQN